MFEQTELFIVESVMWLKLGIELIGALIIAAGIVVALRHLVVEWGRGRSAGFSLVRLELVSDILHRTGITGQSLQ